MKLYKLAIRLKISLCGIGALGALLCTALIFGILERFVEKYPEFANWYWPWTIFIILFAVPCFAILVVGWSIVTNLENNKSFIEANVKKFKLVSGIALTDGIFFFAGNVILWLMGCNHPGIVIFSLIIMFVFVVLSVMLDTLAYLVDSGTRLQLENDLTI